MKTQTLLALALGAFLVTLTGCKDTPIRVTHFADPAATGGGVSSEKPLNLNTDPVSVAGKSDTIAGDGPLIGTVLPDDESLRGRDFDRTAFAHQTVYFEYDHSNVKTGEASKIDQVAAELKAKGAGYDLLIEGHCDERGTEEYNRSLGERRALAIRELLMQSGVDGRHLFTRTFGKDQPASTGHDEAARSLNRRGEFVLVLPKKIITTQNNQ